MASLLSVVREKSLRNKVEVIDDLWESRRDIKIPVGRTVSNHEALERDGLSVLVNLNERVVLVNSPGEVGDVDPGVALS